MSKRDKPEDNMEILNIMNVLDRMENRDQVLEDPVISTDLVEISSPLQLSMPNSNEDVAKAVSIIKDQYAAYLDKYNIKVDFRIDDLFNNLKDLTDPVQMELFKLSLDKTIDRIRLIGLSKLAIALLVALNKITDPAFINSLNPVDAVGYTDKIFSQLQKISKLKSLLNVRDADSQMSHLVREISQKEAPTISLYDESRVMDILKDLDTN